MTTPADRAVIEATEIAERILPCRWSDCELEHFHNVDCPAHYRAALIEALLQFSDEGIDAAMFIVEQREGNPIGWITTRAEAIRSLKYSREGMGK